MIPVDLDWSEIAARLTAPALQGLLPMLLLADDTATVRTTTERIGRMMGPGGASRASVYRAIDSLADAGLATRPTRTGRGIELQLKLPRVSNLHTKVSLYTLSDPAERSNPSAHAAPTSPRALTFERSERSLSQHHPPPERSNPSALSAQNCDSAPPSRALNPENQDKKAAAARNGNQDSQEEAAAAARIGESQEPDTDRRELAEIVGPLDGIAPDRLTDLVLDNREARAAGNRLLIAEFPSPADRVKVRAPGHAIIAAVRRADQVAKRGFQTNRRAFLLSLLDGRKVSRGFIAEAIADKRDQYRRRLSAQAQNEQKTSRAAEALERGRAESAARDMARAEARRLAGQLGAEKTADILSELAREDPVLGRAIMARTREGKSPAEIAAGISIREAFTARVRTIQSGVRRTVTEAET